MTLAVQYAKALLEARHEHPRSAQKLLKNLLALLERRGHSKLLPKIFAEFEKLELRRIRVPHETKERQRTRVLLQLYRHLIRHG